MKLALTKNVVIKLYRGYLPLVYIMRKSLEESKRRIIEGFLVAGEAVPMHVYRMDEWIHNMKWA